MNAELKNIYATFSSERFNTQTTMDYFINPTCFGDDLGKWLLEELDEKGIPSELDGPDQEDFGWYVNFSSDNEDVTCLIIYSEDENLWYLILEKNAGLIGTLFGKRKDKVTPSAINIINNILQNNVDIKNLEWHNMKQHLLYKIKETDKNNNIREDFGTFTDPLTDVLINVDTTLISNHVVPELF